MEGLAGKRGFLLPRALSKIKSAFSAPTTPQARGMRVFLWDGFFMGALETIVLHYIPLFAFAYGASNGEIGLLAAEIGRAHV